MRAGRRSPEYRWISSGGAAAQAPFCLRVLAGGEVLYLDRVETRWPLRLALEPGSRVPLHCTALGKLFLSSMTADEREAVLRGMPLTPCTPRSLTTLPRLLREVRRIAERGYSLDNEEFITGLVTVAVPVVDKRGQTVAALACHAPVARLDLPAPVALVPRLRQEAARHDLARRGDRRDRHLVERVAPESFRLMLDALLVVVGSGMLAAALA